MKIPLNKCLPVNGNIKAPLTEKNLFNSFVIIIFNTNSKIITINIY